MSKLRKLIWYAIHVHFIVNNRLLLDTSTKYEPNKTIAQIMAVGLSHQYGLDRSETEAILCLEPSSYDNKLKWFLKAIKKAANDRQYGIKDTEEERFFKRFLMTSRYIRRRI